MKKQTKIDLYTWGIFLIIFICVVLVSLKLENYLLLVATLILIVMYAVFFALDLVKLLYCVSDLDNNYQDYVLDIKEWENEFLLKKKNIDKKLNKIFEYAFISSIFICGLFVFLGVFLDKMILSLVLPGWILSIILIFFIIKNIVEKNNKVNDLNYKLVKCFIRISNDTIYYNGKIYLKNKIGFRYENNTIYFLKFKIAQFDLSKYKEANYEYLVSACLVGENVKYNGNNNLCEEIKKLYDENKCIIICPEVMGGLTIPRVPSEIVEDRVINQDNLDVTDQYIKGANKALELAILYNIDKAILKSKSPSCGNNKVYDGSFTHTLVDKDGITTRLLKEHGIKCMTEEEYLCEVNSYGKDC